ncbi:MAG: TlyA family RNA methyltransferase [Verrucomicrobiota bacterium]
MKRQGRRLDEALVSAGYFESAEAACRAVMAGQIFVNGSIAAKAGSTVRETDVLSMASKNKYVGRGGLKLEAALDAFSLNPAGRICLDVGASTGGFTDCLLQRGAQSVHAVDVGKGQLDWRLRNDPRVNCLEGTNARFLKRDDLQSVPEFAAGDVSFISLTAVLPAVFHVVETGSDLVFLIKPQFEAPREKVERGGLVRDELVRLESVEKIRKFVVESGHAWMGHIVSPIQGRDGNVEYLCHIRKQPVEVSGGL